MGRKSFSIHSDYYDELVNLPDERRGQLMLALVSWAQDIETPELDPECAILFRLMCAQIDRISRANSNNGAQGGRPNNKSEKSEESEDKRKKPTVTNTVTVTVTESNTNNLLVPSDEKPPESDEVKADTDEYRLAEYLFAQMQVNNPKAKRPNYGKWAKEMGLIMRIDKRSLEDIYAVIDYAQKDSFWMTNILSPKSLRVQFDRLLLKMQNNNSPATKKKDSWEEIFDEPG